MVDDTAIDLEVLARTTRRAARLAALACAVALVVLAIDNTIKRAIVTRAQEATEALDEIKRIYEEAHRERPSSGKAASPDRSPGPAGDDVVHDAPAGTVLAPAGGPAKAPRAKRPASPKRGTAGNDSRTQGH